MFGLKRRNRTRQPRPTRGRDIAVAGRRVPLTIREHDRATRMTLRIEPGGRALRMSVPVGISEREIDGFLHRHHGWLATRLGKLPKPAALQEGATITICGTPHRIEPPPVRQLLGPRAGASAIRSSTGDRLVMRIVAADGFELRHQLIPVIEMCNEKLCGSRLPKIWTV